MSTAVANAKPTAPDGMSAQQVELIKRTIVKGATDDELALFLNQCRRTGLDPFNRQIYAVKRREQDESGNWVERLTVQTGIDGYRLIAERTERYLPGPDATFAYDKAGNLVSATAHVKKRVGSEWHDVAATAFWAEFVQTKRDGSPTKFWKKMPHLMLAKCAEALALRRAFPLELSGIYTTEEMGGEAQDAEIVQADARPSPPKQPALPAPVPAQQRPAKIDSEQWAEIDRLIKETGTDPAAFAANYAVGKVEDLPADHYTHARYLLMRKKAKQDSGAMASTAQVDRIAALRERKGLAWDELNALLREEYHADHLRKISGQQADDLIRRLAEIDGGDVPPPAGDEGDEIGA